MLGQQSCSPVYCGWLTPAGARLRAERQSSCLLGLGAGTVPNLSSWKVPLSLSSCLRSSAVACPSVNQFCISHVTIFLNVEFCYCEAWLCLRINIKKKRQWFLQSSTASKTASAAQNRLFCLYCVCRSFRASRITWAWSQSCVLLCRCETSVQQATNPVQGLVFCSCLQHESSCMKWQVLPEALCRFCWDTCMFELFL